MRVANVIEEARVGGPQRRIAAVGARLKRLGIESVVVGPVEDSARFRGLLEEHGLPYSAQRLERPAKGLWRMIRYIALFLPDVRRLARALESGRFDLVHVSGGAMQTRGVIAARIAGVPAVWHLNDTKRPLPIRLAFRLVSRCFPTSFIVAGSRVREYYLAGRRSERLPVFEIQAPVDTVQFDPGTVEPDGRLAQRAGPLVVLLAVVNPDKDVATFVEAAAHVTADPTPAEFWIVGPTHASQTAYRAELERLIEKRGLAGRVRFYGAAAAPEAVLAAADVAVCTSRAEASPMAVWEAMAMARPVVSTDVGDVRRFLEASGAGFVVPVGDAGGLAQRIVELLGDAELRKTMGDRGREVVATRLSLERCVDAHVEAYTTLARGNR